jgi:hypothetical protein
VYQWLCKMFWEWKSGNRPSSSLQTLCHSVLHWEQCSQGTVSSADLPCVYLLWGQLRASRRAYTSKTSNCLDECRVWNAT